MNNKRIKGVYKLLLVVIIVFIPNKGYCDEYDITLSRNDFDLKGPVVKVTIKDCQFKEEFGELIRSGSKDKNIFFYGNGNVYKIVNSPNTYKRYNYDDHGYLIYEMQVNTGGGIPQIIDDFSFCDDDTTDVKEYKHVYNENGKIAETKVFNVRNGSSTQTVRIIYSYTNGGRNITTRDKDGIIKEVTINGLNRILRENTKQLSWRVSSDKLDNKGRLIQRNVSLEYEFMNLKKVQKVSSESYSYDNNGNVIKKNYTLYLDRQKPLVGVTTVKYTYDSHGNWTRMLSYNGNKLVSWQERDIIYAKNENDYDSFIEHEALTEKMRRQKINEYQLKIAKKNAAIEAKKEEERAKGPICELPDVFAHFPGDSPATRDSPSPTWDHMYAWINANKKDVPFSGRVRVAFVVEQDGSLSNVRIARGQSDDLNNEAIRLVNKMPKWVPANNDGEVVRSNIIIDIFF